MKKIVFTLLVCISIQSVMAQKNTPLTIATYNIRYNNPGDSLNAWPNRKENVKALIRFHEFDIFGTQEGLIDQMNGLSEMEEFARTGHGRDDGKEAGEHSAIFYKKDRFKLIESGDFWLSKTPGNPAKAGMPNAVTAFAPGESFRTFKPKKRFISSACISITRAL